MEFVQSVRKHMTEKRLAAIRFTFEFLDRERRGQLDAGWMLGNYCAGMHPHVRTRVKTEEQIRGEFERAIGRWAEGGVVSEQNFLEYYADVNACIPHEREEYFIDIVLQCWSIKENKFYISEQRIDDLELLFYEKIRQKTTDATDEGTTFKRFCKYYDIEDKKLIDLVAFRSVLEKVGCCFKEAEIVALFNRRDLGRRGYLNYEDYSAVFLRIGSGRKLNPNPVFDMAARTGGASSTHGMTK